MGLEQFFYLSQILAAIAVVASLLFVGFELRHGTRATRAQIHQNFTHGWLSLGPMIADNSRIFAAGITADEAGFRAMPNDEKLAFMSIVFAFFKHYENMYEQQKEGFIRAEDWEAWARHMFMYWRMPGVQVWWRYRGAAFAPDFRQFLETSPQPPLMTTAEIFQSLGPTLDVDGGHR
jgi:hypothetical protein